MSEKRYPDLETYLHKGKIDSAYIKLCEEKSHHCRQSVTQPDIIYDFDSGNRIIGIEILYPIDNEMRAEILGSMLLFGISQGDADSIMARLENPSQEEMLP